jgi:uncharacterized protein YbaR (Trm112 family)
MEKNDKLSKELLEILACPKCKGDIEYLEKENILVCRTCGVYYEIIEGIPDMIPEHAKPLKGKEKSNL